MNANWDTEDIDKFISECEQKWKTHSEESTMMSFKNNLLALLSNLSSDYAREIIIRLLQKYDYYSQSVVNTGLKSLHEKLCKTGLYSIIDTVFSPIPSAVPRCNSSYEYIYEYKRINEINNASICMDIVRLPQESLERIRTIVFIDDMCGSGDTFVDYIESVKEIVKNKSIVYMSIYAMEEGYSRIEKLVDSGFSISLISNIKRDKAFKDDIFSNEDRVEFGQESKRIGITKYIYGYKDVEALVSFYNNTPNDTLGLFWEDTENNNALFPRTKRIGPLSPYSMKNAKKLREKKNRSIRR